MALLKFNKAELVNLSYSLKREIISENKEGAYINTSIITCNTRRYHGLLALTLDRFGGDRFLLLSSLDESITIGGKQFNLGIHCYGDIYEPRGHKYVVDFSATPVPQITYKIGDIVFRKTLLLCPDRDQLLINYELLEAPASATVQFRPLLAFRNIHILCKIRKCNHASGRTFQYRMINIVFSTICILLQLTVVPVLHRAIITGNTAVNLGLCSTVRTGFHLSCQITVLLTDGVGRR